MHSQRRSPSIVKLRKSLSGNHVILLTLLIVMFALPGSGEAFIFHRWDKNVTENGFEFDKLRHEKNGTIIGYMKQDTVVDGFPCAKGWIHFYSDWSLEGILLSKDMNINGNDIPAHTWIAFDRDGILIRCSFPVDTMIQGHLCDGKVGGGGIHTAFYPSGKLKSYYPPKTVIVDGILCKRSLFYSIGLHKNGRLRWCKLAETTLIDDISYRKNRKIIFDEDGKVVSVK